MKQETNNEMDLLLRRLGRRHDESASAAGDHLDADELNAYAENVLPAAARARYTEHLADCSTCREMVMQLSSSAGVVVAHETVKIAAPSLLKRILAGFFSPMVLRYAAPALGLIVVAVIGLIVLRRERPEDLVTQVRQESPAPVSPAQATDQNSSGFLDSQKTNPSTNDSINKPAENKTAAGAPPPPNSAPVVEGAAASASPQAAEKKVEQAAANEPPPPAPKPTPVSTEEKQQQAVTVDAREDTVRTSTPTIQSSVDKARTRRQERAAADFNEDRDASATKKNPDAKAAPAGVGSLAALSQARAEKREKEKDDSAETRSVAGRRFRKEGGVWIDTAYDSRSTTNLTRGSEQYRALIADEPAIKTIADQLDGEIIVVWKGRAYRIR